MFAEQTGLEAMEETKWIICPDCGGKTRVKIKQTTIMKDFLLWIWGEFNITEECI